MSIVTRRYAGRAILGGLAAASLIRDARAQAWPSRPITLVVPFPPGGSSDVVARALGRSLGEALGQPVVVDNRSGATGNIGAQAVTRARPDGHTLLLATSGPGATNRLLFRNLPFDPRRDFTPIALIAEVPLVVIAGPRIEARSLPELVALARARPGGLDYGTPGAGAMGHLAAARLEFLTRIRMNHVPYRGSAPLNTDLLGGTLALGFDFVASYVDQIRSGTLRALAVTSAERLSALPDVPTAVEQGIADYVATSWFALLGPAGMPAAVTERLNAATNAFVANAEARTLLTGLGATPRGGTPEAMGARIVAELATWEPIIREASISLE